jgi:hypothetical protein
MALKKTASILLLCLLLFNWCGYRWVINIVQQKADLELEAKLDRNDYDDSQLIVITVPVSLPYQTDWANFERCDGEIELNGFHYKYVKRKIEGGQLVLKCIPNKAKQRLESAKSHFFKYNNDLEQDKGTRKSHDPNSCPEKNPVNDYLTSQFQNFSALNTALLLNSYNLYRLPLVPALSYSAPAQPPEA